jgi:hypothetical protein
MLDFELVNLRLNELQEALDELRYQNFKMKVTLQDIVSQNRDTNERTLAKLCLEELELLKE